MNFIKNVYAQFPSHVHISDSFCDIWVRWGRKSTFRHTSALWVFPPQFVPAHMCDQWSKAGKKEPCNLPEPWSRAWHTRHKLTWEDISGEWSRGHWQTRRLCYSMNLNWLFCFNEYKLETVIALCSHLRCMLM